jgi:hypothetical protein
MAYPIFDIAPNTVDRREEIYFVRYQEQPQGNQIYFGRGVEGGSNRIVHEVCGVFGDSPSFGTGQNVFENWRNRSIQFDYVSNYPADFREKNPDPLYERNIF